MNPTPINEIFEKYKHLDGVLSDPDWCKGSVIYAITGEMWRAIKDARENK